MSLFWLKVRAYFLAQKAHKIGASSKLKEARADLLIAEANRDTSISQAITRYRVATDLAIQDIEQISQQHQQAQARIMEDLNV